MPFFFVLINFVFILLVKDRPTSYKGVDKPFLFLIFFFKGSVVDFFFVSSLILRQYIFFLILYQGVIKFFKTKMKYIVCYYRQCFFLSKRGSTSSDILVANHRY